MIDVIVKAVNEGGSTILIFILNVIDLEILLIYCFLYRQLLPTMGKPDGNRV